MTKPRPIVLAVTAMILALAGATAAYATPHGARSASAGPTVNLAAAAKGCAVLHVALHGTKAPTITCLSRTGPPISAGRAGRAIFSTGTINCQDAASNLSIVTTDGAICYSGKGYIGLSPVLTGVEVISAKYESWVRLYYNSAGTYFNLQSGGANAAFLPATGDVYGPEDVTVTQVDDDEGPHD